MGGGGANSPVVRQVPRAHKLEGDGPRRIGAQSPEQDMFRPGEGLRKLPREAVSAGYSVGQDRAAGTLSVSPRSEARVVTMGSSGPESGPLLVGGGVGNSPNSNAARVSIAPGNSATVFTQGGGKISFSVGQSAVSGSAGGSSPRRTITPTASCPIPTPGLQSAGRGAPPPVPPNKPNIPPGSSPKPVPPPKVGVMGRGGEGSGKVVQIPVSVVPSPGPSPSPSPASSNQSSRETSPIRKAAQVCVHAKS